MNELKTLKDISKYLDPWETFEIVYTKPLRKEVINWIKARQYKILNLRSDMTKEVCEHIHTEIKFWMERFNITEEDLK